MDKVVKKKISCRGGGRGRGGRRGVDSGRERQEKSFREEKVGGGLVCDAVYSRGLDNVSDTDTHTHKSRHTQYIVIACRISIGSLNKWIISFIIIIFCVYPSTS